jgi:multisubunit Na+/H+ antiporter MnhB subunit
MMSTVILRTSVRLLIPLSLVFSVFIYFKGHQTPGGGFVGGLMLAAAIVIQRMSDGGASMRKLMPFSPRLLIASGLLLALGTGIGAIGFGLPFFTSNHGYIPLPGGGGKFEWATVMIFDLGVMLTVAGVVVGIIDALSQELE